PGEQESVLAQMKKFTRECMDEYARNFYREKIKSGDDLVWYGRVETERHYKNDDPEVKAGRVKAGDKKPGLQLHVHVIVSRMDRTQTVSLSPLSKSRGNRQILEGRQVVVGFDRSQWSSRCASRFNQSYDYFPNYYSRDESLRKYSENWQAKNELKNEAVSKLKQEVLKGELKEERRLYANTFRIYRFVVNPRKAIIQELKRL
ncbi:pathogenicity island mobilization protein BfmB, partial [Bacteroides fragilis]